MSKLSPAAQAVLNAYCTHADLLNREVSHEEMLAAALRAAADGLRIDMTATACINHLYRIAAELEGFSG